VNRAESLGELFTVEEVKYLLEPRSCTDSGTSIRVPSSSHSYRVTLSSASAHCCKAAAFSSK
jgi:hypothetical protein